MINDFDKYQSNIEIAIYNLWGDIIYHSDQYQNDWDGTYNGNPLDAGTYYFVLKSADRKGTMGYIDILK
jgi:gliding motility-associated-like protein